MATRSVDIAGDSPAAQAYRAGARMLGWNHPDTGQPQSGDIVVTAPLASTLAQADALIGSGGRPAFGWPLVSTSPVQELLRRVTSVGTITAISAHSTRPMPTDLGSPPAGVLFQSAHDHIALTLLVARVAGLGAPVSISATAAINVDRVDDSVDLVVTFEGGLRAAVHADWHSAAVFSREFQVAGELGVLRSETDPRPALEFNGDTVRLPSPRIVDEQHRPLHESGVIDMLTTIGAGFDSGTLPHAFTLTFGRDVLAVIIAAYQSIVDQAPVAVPFEGDRDASPATILAH